MKTPKEKAWELLQTIESIYINDDNYDSEKTRQCALICVDEILEIKSVYHDIDLYDYWEEVKQEIKKK